MRQKINNKKAEPTIGMHIPTFYMGPSVMSIHHVHPDKSVYFLLGETIIDRQLRIETFVGFGK